jgi:hypothetical protein
MGNCPPANWNSDGMNSDVRHIRRDVDGAVT